MKPTTLLIGVLTSSIAFSFTTPASASISPFATKTPSQILVIAAAAMNQAGSVHLLGTVSFPGLHGTVMLDSADDESTQTIVVGAARETDLVFGTSVFLRGNAADFFKSFHVEHSPLVDQWVQVPSRNSNYESTLSGELFASLTRQTVQLDDVKNLGARTFEGQPVVAISGKLPSSRVFPGASQTVYISTASPFLPIGYGDTFNELGKSGTALGLFTKWGESVNVTRPSVFITATAMDLP
jgi:hypothetical protein